MYIYIQSTYDKWNVQMTGKCPTYPTLRIIINNNCDT